MNCCLAHPPAPLPMIACCWLLETVLARLVCFFAALERRLPPFTILMLIGSLPWSIHRLGWWSGLASAIPLGLSMALTVGLAIIITLFLVGLAVWLLLIPLHVIADYAGWRLPAVLEQHPVVSHWLHNWRRLGRQEKGAVQFCCWLVIGLLLGCWVGED